MNSISQKAPRIARYLLGTLLVVFGLNGFFNFMPTPPVEGAALAFLGGLASAPYFFPLVKLIEIGVGVALLAGRFVPLALIILAPISVNIVAFHVFLEPAGTGPAALVFLLNAYLGWAYRSAYSGVLSASAQPVEREATPPLSAAEPLPH